jgi:hypothetical protein
LCCVDRIRQPGDFDDGTPIRDKVKVDVPVVTVIKFQALARGFLVRNRIKKSHGFQRSPGMLHQNVSKLSNEELEAFRLKV